MPPGPELLKAWRLAAGLTQAEAARQLRSSQGAYCDWETGTKTPRLPGLLKIKNRTGIAPESFAEDETPVLDTGSAKATDRCPSCDHTRRKHYRMIGSDPIGCAVKGCTCRRFDLPAETARSARRSPPRAAKPHRKPERHAA